jgi:acetyltransferase
VIFVDVHNLDRIFRPERVAIFGVTQNPRGVGATVLRNIVSGGFRGVVYPIDPNYEAVLGIPCFRSLRSLPATPDLALVCAPASAVPDIVQQCGEAGVLGVVVVSAGFGEAGKEGRELEARLSEIVKSYPGMRLVGPNCLGFMAPGMGLNASFAAGMPKAGRIAFISQSGALCTSVLDWALERGIGFSYFVSVGNSLDVDFGDLIDYFGENDGTDAIILYVESLKHARSFMTAARAFARTKPIIAYKGGRFAESAAVAGSHTGAMAGEDAVYDAAFERAGIARVYEIGEIFDCAELLARYGRVGGPRLAIVTNAGGPGVMATDTLVEQQGALAELSETTLDALDESLPPMWSQRNPVDVLGDARPKRYAKAVEVVLQDSGVDAVLVILSPQAMTKPTATAKAVAELASSTSKPVLAAWLGGRSTRESAELFAASGIACYRTPEQAVRAFMTLVRYSKNLEALYETPRDIPVHFPLDRQKLRTLFESVLPDRGEVLSESISKSLLSAYGIPTAEPVPARDVDDAVEAAERMGFPVVLKVHSPDITHKTDVGGVALDLHDPAAVRRAFDRVTEAARTAVPDARVDGVTVQPMIRREGACELILGAKKDPTFGAVVLLGLGGVTAEVMKDRTLAFPPLNESLARRLIESLAGYPLLRGYRGRPPADLDGLIEVIMRFSYLVADFPAIREMDVNPLLAGPDGAVALDARVMLDRELVGRGVKPYSHLALRPYPEEFVSDVTLPDGTALRLRPIRPEDEPRWKDMLASCSQATIHSRFGYLFHFAKHEEATRYCFIDYDREMAIVAEADEGGKRKLVGVGRLVADPARTSAEYAVLVTDDFQGRGLGRALTEYCIRVARRWGVKRIVAETVPANEAMVAIFEKLGFAVEEKGAVVEVAMDVPG